MQPSDITVPPINNPLLVSILGSIIILIVAVLASIVIWVYRIGYPENAKGQTKVPQICVIILTLLAVFSPEAISFQSTSTGTQETYLVAMWFNILGIILAGHAFNLSFFVIAIPLTILRVGFPLMVYRYFRRMESRRRVLVYGLLAELPSLLFGIPLLIVLVFGSLAIFLIPLPIGPTGWLEQEG